MEIEEEDIIARQWVLSQDVGELVVVLVLAVRPPIMLIGSRLIPAALPFLVLHTPVEVGYERRCMTHPLGNDVVWLDRIKP
jgi:hypothetical protein